MEKNQFWPRDQVAQPLYDSVTFQNMPERLLFFERPVGQTGSDLTPKGFEDTNIHMVNMLPMGLDFLCTSLGVYFVPDCGGGSNATREQNIADVLTVLGQGLLELRIKNRRWLEISPLAAVPPAFPMYWAHDDARLDDMFKGRVIASGEGLPPQEHGEGFKIVPLLIPSQTYFHVEVRFKRRSRLNRIGKLGVILYGRLIRDAL